MSTFHTFRMSINTHTPATLSPTQSLKSLAELLSLLSIFIKYDDVRVGFGIL